MGKQCNDNCDICTVSKKKWSKFIIDDDDDLCLVERQTHRKLRMIELIYVKPYQNSYNDHTKYFEETYKKAYSLDLEGCQDQLITYDFERSITNHFMTGITLREVLYRAGRIIRVLAFIQQIQQPVVEKPKTKRMKLRQHAIPEPEPEIVWNKPNLKKLTSIPDLNRYILDFLD